MNFEEEYWRSMSESHASTDEHHEPERYEIRIQGHLDDRWADWFEGMTITREAGGSTLLVGLVVDQSALHGLLKKVRDLGLPLISVMPAESEQPDMPDDNADDDHNHSNEETNP
jgi:hypothetical protein